MSNARESRSARTLVSLRPWFHGPESLHGQRAFKLPAYGPIYTSSALFHMPLFRLTLFLVLVALSGGPLSARPYRIATTPWMGWAFLDVAEAKGFWKAEGLEVELKAYPDGTSYLDAQLAHLVDFSCGMVGDVVWIHAHRAPVRILLETDWSLGGDKFFLRRGQTLRNLKGRPVGYYQARYSLPFFLWKTLGKDYECIQASPAAVFNPSDLLAQFRAGRLDMGVLCDPFLDALGPEALIRCTSADIPGSLPECFFTFQDVAQAMPARDLEGLVQGVLRAVAWMQDARNAEELFRIVQARSYRQLPLRDVADMRAQMRHAPTHGAELMWERNGPGMDGYLRELRLFLRNYDPPAASYQPSELFNADWTRHVLATRGRR